MGNNHNKYFDQSKRKVLILGLSQSGKTTLLRMIKGDKKGKGSLYVPTELFNNEQIKLKKNLQLDVWDLGGKLPHLWVHHFKGTQGVIFLIDQIATTLNDQNMQAVIQELLNVIVGNPSIPIVVFVNEKTNLAQNLQDRLSSISSQLQQSSANSSIDFKSQQRAALSIDQEWLDKNVFSRLDNEARQELEQRLRVFNLDLIREKSFDQLDFKKGESNIISEAVQFLVENMKPL